MALGKRLDDLLDATVVFSFSNIGYKLRRSGWDEIPVLVNNGGAPFTERGVTSEGMGTPQSGIPSDRTSCGILLIGRMCRPCGPPRTRAVS